MAERSLRGSNLSTLSLETEEGIIFSERQIAHYVCLEGHVNELPFSVDAEIPTLWECHCGANAKLEDGPEPQCKSFKPQRTHWDMLLERRSILELEELLEDRLTLLRKSRNEKPRRKRSA